MNITDPAFEIAGPLTLPADEVHVWRIDLDAIRGDFLRWQAVLSPDEVARSQRFHFARDRERFVAARAWLRKILAAYLAAEASELRFSYSKKEKPSLDAASDVNFNVSHSGGVALLGFTRGREIGIDVEELRANSDLEAIARRFFSPQEQKEFFDLPGEQRVEAFFRCWTLKEAYIKATGDGLSLPLSQFDVSLNANEANALLATRPDPSEAGRWRITEVAAGSGYRAAVCVRGDDWKLRD